MPSEEYEGPGGEGGAAAAENEDGPMYGCTRCVVWVKCTHEEAARAEIDTNDDNWLCAACAQKVDGDAALADDGDLVIAHKNLTSSMQKKVEAGKKYTLHTVSIDASHLHVDVLLQQSLHGRHRAACRTAPLRACAI